MAFTKTIIINIKTLIQCWVSMATNEDELNYSTNTCLIVNSFRSIRTNRKIDEVGQDMAAIKMHSDRV